MSFSQDLNQPPPGFGTNYLPNQQHKQQTTFGPPSNAYAIPPPPFNVPPPNFTVPPSTQFNAPPPIVPVFTGPPPNWNGRSASQSFATATDGVYQNNHFRYNPPPHASNVQQPPTVLDLFKYPPPPSQHVNGYGGATNQAVENRQPQTAYASNSSYNSHQRYGRASSSGAVNPQHSRAGSGSNSPYAPSNSRSQSTEPSRDRSSRDQRESRDYRDRRDRSSSRTINDRSDYNRSSSSRNGRASSSNRYDRSVADRQQTTTRDGSRDGNTYRPGSAAASSLADESVESERDELLTKWRSNYCEHFDDIKRKLTEMEPSASNVKESWVRSSPSDIYYERASASTVNATARLKTLCSLFETDLLKRGAEVRAALPPYSVPPRKRKHKVCRHKCR